MRLGSWLALSSCLAIVISFEPGNAQVPGNRDNLTPICKLLKGPRAGTSLYFESPIRVGARCTDGKGSSGVSVSASADTIRKLRPNVPKVLTRGPPKVLTRGPLSAGVKGGISVENGVIETKPWRFCAPPCPKPIPGFAF